MLAGDAKKEFNAIVAEDIDKVNKHFRAKLQEYKQRFQQLYEQIRELGIEEKARRARDSNGGSISGSSSNSAVIEIPHDSPTSTLHAPTPIAPSSSSSSSSALSTPSSFLRPLNLIIRPTSPLSLPPLTPPPAPHRPTISISHSRKLESLSERLLLLYRECCQLDSFATLNYDGLRKIMKKYDKQTGEDGHQEQMKARLESEPFMKQLDEVRKLQKLEENLYHRIEIRRGIDIRDAMTKLKLVKKEVDEPPETDDDAGSHVRYYYILAAFVTYFLLLFIPLFPDEQERAQRCAALLALITILWVSEAIPFFVSSLMIPFFVILNGILADESGEALSATKASKAAFGCMFNDTIMLILGGFSISAAFSKCGFELRLASIIQRQLGSRPILFLFAFMALGAFLSMWISNVAAPVLLTSLLLPIVSEFGSGPADERVYARALLLGLALSCNIGGMMSPISSPQNAIALGFLEAQDPAHAISFMQWLYVSVPFCTAGLTIAWLWLTRVYIGPGVDVPAIPDIVYDERPLNRTDWSVIGVSLLTILLWCSLTYTRPVLGEMGTVAVIPMVIFFGTGFLSKADLFTFKWDLILLVGGGSVLGAAVNSSRLLHIISEWIRPHLEGQPLLLTLFAVLFLVFLITTFVSHTVAALILTPLLINIGANAGHTQVVVMASTLMMSGTMSLPTSSFPNINSLSQEDDFGRPFLRSGDFLRHGTAVAVMLFGLLYVVSVSYMRVVFAADAEMGGAAAAG